MSLSIPAIDTNRIQHGVLIRLDLSNPAYPGTPGAARTVSYYISNCASNVVYDGNTYVALGGFLNIADIQNSLQNTNEEIIISLSAIPATYIEATIGNPIKGGVVKLYRVFFDPATGLVQSVNGADQVFLRFNGIITNFTVSEDVQDDTPAVEVSHTIGIACSSIIGVLDNRISGRRTNRRNYQVQYAEFANTDSTYTGGTQSRILTDPSMNRIEVLKNAQFDFGKPLQK